VQKNSPHPVSREIDPDLLTVSMLAVASISAVGTLIQSIVSVISLKDTRRREVARENASQIYENIEESVRDMRRAFERIETIFEQQQQRTQSNNFENEPRFGTFAVNFSREEFASYQRQDQNLARSLNGLRTWSLHMQSQISSCRFPNEEALAYELGDLVEVSNTIIFDTKTHREQARLIKTSLERIERAIEGARRKQN
jgi:hypothetical protein